MKLSILIVSWNTKQLTLDCLQSVYEYPPAYEFDVWVVDNDSSDGSAEAVADLFPQAHLICSAKNVGFAGGNNLAIEQITAEYVLLLNPDTVVKPHALTELVRFLDETPRAGVAGSMLLNPDESLQPSCHPSPTLSRELWRLLHLDKLYPYGAYHMHKWDMTQPREVDIIQGASMMIRTAILDKIGFMDGDYFMYSEEVDLCYRLQKAGWHIFWVPSSKVIHYGGQSTRQVATNMFLQLYLGKLMYFRKHYGANAGRGYKLILFVTSLLRLLLTPLALLEQGEKRELHLTLSRRYAKLVRSLPTM